MTSGIVYVVNSIHGWPSAQVFAEHIACYISSRRPGRSNDSNNGVSGPNYYSLSSFWALETLTAA